MSSLGTSKDLQKLRILCAECDSDLQLTQDIARFLDVLKATNCQNLEASASSTASQISDMHASPLIGDCLDHVHTLGSKNHLKSLLIQMGTKCQISNVAEDGVFQSADGTWESYLLLCDDKSDWLTFTCKGCSIIFDVQTMKGSNLKSMMLYIVYYSCSENITSEGCHGMLIINYTKATIHAYKRDTLTSFEDEDWQSITSNLEPGNKVGVMVVFGEGFIVEKTTVSLLYDEPVVTEMESCDAVDEEDAIVSGNDDNSVSVSGGDNEAINCFGEETADHMQIIRHADGLYADAVGRPDQLAEAVAEEFPAAEANGDQEQRIPPTEGHWVGLWNSDFGCSQRAEG
ncbi:disease resistance protein RPV1 [Trifolium repens]|nr:disease resistance protein RPV1 [Trifolium repens]